MQFLSDKFAYFDIEHNCSKVNLQSIQSVDMIKVNCL